MEIKIWSYKINMSDFRIEESDTVEYKEIVNDSLIKEVVSFLNYKKGGHIYIGINNEGKTTGVLNPDQTQLKIINMIKDNISPSCLGLFDVVLEKSEDKSIIHIIVSSGQEKPYYIKQLGMSSRGCFIRVGSSAQPMTQNMIDDLYSKRTRNSLSKIPSPHQDLTFTQLKIYYEGQHKTLNDNFAKNLDLLTEDGKYNYTAYLLSDTNSVSIKVAKYLGKDKYDLIENQEYGYCSLIKATNAVLDKFDIENITRTKITSRNRLEKNLVDRIALREAIINAIVHNDYSSEVPPLFEIYSDRFVITSYGGLIDGLSKEEFFNCVSKPRNRELMRVFRDLELVEQLGSGMTRILRTNDTSIFNFMEHFMQVTFYFTKGFEEKEPNNETTESREESRDKSRDKIIELIKNNPKITTKEMAESLGLTIKAIEKQIKILKDNKTIERVGSKKDGYWNVVVE